MSICAPNWSCVPAFWICGAKPKCTPRFIPASLPFASKVANAGSRPVRTLELDGPLLLTLVNVQKAFTLPAKENAHPLDICIVSWALAAAGSSTATASNNSARRFIRESLLGSVPAQTSARALLGAGSARYSRVGTWCSPPVMLVELGLRCDRLDLRNAEPTSSSWRVDYGLPRGVAARDGVRLEPTTSRRIHIPAAPWPGTPQNIR